MVTLMTGRGWQAPFDGYVSPGWWQKAKKKMGHIQPILHLVEYRSYRILDEYGNKIINPNFTRECGQILDLKKETERGHAAAVRTFALKTESTLKAYNVPPANLQVHIVLVPSSTQGKWSPGLLKIGEQLCRKNRNFIDSMRALERTATIQKLANGGARNLDVHFRSIELRQPAKLMQKTVLLLDDVTTTGNSLHACAQLLSQHGAAVIMPLAIGRTV